MRLFALSLIALLCLSVSRPGLAQRPDPELLWAPVRFEGQKHLSIRRIVEPSGRVDYRININPAFIYQDAIIKAPLRCGEGEAICFDLEIRAIEVIWGLNPGASTDRTGFRIEGESFFRMLNYARLETVIDTEKSGFIRVQSYGGDHYLILITKVVPVFKVESMGRSAKDGEGVG